MKIKIKTIKIKNSDVKRKMYKVELCECCNYPYIHEVAIHTKAEDDGWNGAFYFLKNGESYLSICETRLKSYRTVFTTKKEAMDYISKKYGVSK